jgi:endonuclease V-like protein UPF0215 family
MSLVLAWYNFMSKIPVAASTLTNPMQANWRYKPNVNEVEAALNAQTLKPRLNRTISAMIHPNEI